LNRIRCFSHKCLEIFTCFICIISYMTKHQLFKGVLQIHLNTNSKFMWTVDKSKNNKSFIGTDITEGFITEPTSPKYSVTCSITGCHVHPCPPMIVKTCIHRKELDHCNNQLSFNKFIIKHNYEQKCRIWMWRMLLACCA
jgi:hypothetical protein